MACFPLIPALPSPSLPLSPTPPDSSETQASQGACNCNPSSSQLQVPPCLCRVLPVPYVKPSEREKGSQRSQSLLWPPAYIPQHPGGDHRDTAPVCEHGHYSSSPPRTSGLHFSCIHTLSKASCSTPHLGHGLQKASFQLLWKAGCLLPILQRKKLRLRSHTQAQLPSTL